METIYNVAFNEVNFSAFDRESDIILDEVKSGRYLLSPIRVEFIRNADLQTYLMQIGPKCVSYYFVIPSGTSPDESIVFRADFRDTLVLMGLAQILFDLSICACRPPEEERVGASINHIVGNFYNSFKAMGRVNQLHRVHILFPLPNDIMLHGVKHYVDDALFSLISQFLSLPCLTEDGYDVREVTPFPPLGELYRVILNIAMIQSFDHYMESHHPSLPYSRHICQVFLGLSSEKGKMDEVKKMVKEALGSEKIAFTHICVYPGDKPVSCYGRREVSIEERSLKVIIKEKE
jgi:hypothetical protein